MRWWLVLLVLAVGPAAAHQAASGWVYDYDCCHSLDCAPAPGAVREVRGGYEVAVAPGSHPMVPAGGAWVRGFVAHGDPRIRPSGDSDRHVCISGTGRILCVYVPPGGV